MFLLCITQNKQQSKALKMNTVRIFVPRILPQITTQMMKNTFTSFGLGEVINIDIRHRINAHNYHYAFAFLLVKLYNTDHAKQVWRDIVDNGSHQLVYDSPNYWELKNYIARDQRDYYDDTEEEEEIEESDADIKDDLIVDSNDQPSWSEIVNRKFPKIQNDNNSLVEQEIQKRVQEYIDKNLENIIIQKVLEMPYLGGFDQKVKTSRYVSVEEEPKNEVDDIQKLCYELSKPLLPNWSNSQNVYQVHNEYPSAFSLFSKTKSTKYNLADDYTSIHYDIWSTVGCSPLPAPVSNCKYYSYF
jgi:hypothetical protein